MTNEIAIFEDQKIKLEVNVKDETVWLTQRQMAKLFGKSASTINEHIKNIYAEEELIPQDTLIKFGNSEFSKKPCNYYNLDMIISVGYRVKSKEGVRFRKWATSVLKEHLIKGYTINQKRLEYLEKTVKLIDIASRIDYELDNAEAQKIIKTINSYSKALSLLDGYDKKIIKKPMGNLSDDHISYDDCKRIIDRLGFKGLFGMEMNRGLESIISNLYATYNGYDVYETIEEKASNLLYLIIKDHVFIDGNKRIAATLFIYFLNYYGILYRNTKQVIDNNTLVAITILIAQSNPKEKDILIDLLMNFLIDK